MYKVLLGIVVCFSLEVKAQAPNTVSTLTLLPQTQSNWEEFTSTHQTVKEAAKANKDKFSCVLNLIKSALSEELDKPQCYIGEETIPDCGLTSIKNILEEDQAKKIHEEDRNKTDSEKALYQKIFTKIASAFSKPQNVTRNQNDNEIRSMIPIFKQRTSQPRSELSQNVADINHASRPIPKSRVISFVPEKIIQTNFSPISNPLPFSIPCQRAADVLDMSIPNPNEATRSKIPDKSNVSPNTELTKLDIASQISAPVTLSVNCADSDDTVAMLFKPKNISLMQLYGNLLKKITITVLMPYHMSKLGQS